MERHRLNKQGFAIMVLAFVWVGVVSGCNKEITVHTNSGSGPPRGGEVNNPVDNTPTTDPDDDETHGPDDDQVVIEPGFLNGSWRVATAEQDRPLVYLDLFHDQGATEVTGTFWMGNAVSDILDGEVGDLLSAQWAGEHFEVRWNPTMDEEEVYKITEGRRVSDDRLEGKFSADKDPITFDVVIERRVVDDEEETSE
jgi:hypothetical protein